MRSMGSRRPPYAAAGSPPPRTLPITTRPGLAAVSSRAPPRGAGDEGGALLPAGAGDAEAGDDLVEDEQGAGLGRPLAQQLEEALGRRHEAHVGGGRFAQERSDVE